MGKLIAKLLNQIIKIKNKIKSGKMKFNIYKNKNELLSIKDNVQNLFKMVFNRSLTDNEWEHYYLNSPLQDVVSFVGYENDTLIAHGAIIKQQLKDDQGNIFSYFIQTAIMVHPEHRNLLCFNSLMQTIHDYVNSANTFVMAFPNDNSYGPFIQMLRWHKITEYKIKQYSFAKEDIDRAENSQVDQQDYQYSLNIDERFFKWRSELNNMKLHNLDPGNIIYKDYEGALEILDVNGKNVLLKNIMQQLGFEKVNLPDCFLASVNMNGLSFNIEVGNTQRMCVYPNKSKNIDYAAIKPSLLFSDVF
ncbi:hypothetical protein BVY03_03405 [bacterium K02(2017)]|nr:hypothetical protein BVY03_03405 [bacterium K02(2017)]